MVPICAKKILWTATPFIKNNIENGIAPPNCKFSGLLRYNCSKGPKGLQFFTYTQRANSVLSVLHCDTYSGNVNYPNITVIPEMEGTNDMWSEGGGEQLRLGIQWSYHRQGWMIKTVKEAKTDDDGDWSIGMHPMLLSLFALKRGEWFYDKVKMSKKPEPKVLDKLQHEITYLFQINSASKIFFLDNYKLVIFDMNLVCLICC